MYVAGRDFNKVIDCFNALESSCQYTSETTIKTVESSVNSMCTEKNYLTNMVHALAISTRQERQPNAHKRTRVMYTVSLVTLASYASRFSRRHNKLVSRENNYAVKCIRVHAGEKTNGTFEINDQHTY